MKRRLPKEIDQKNIEKAFRLLKEFMSHHDEIEPTLWAGAFWSVLAEGYRNSGFSYEQFSKECDLVRCNYESWFDL